MKMNWYILSIIAMVSFAIVFLLIKKLTVMKVDSSMIYFYNSAIAAVIVLLYLFYDKISLNVTTNVFLILLAISIFAVIGNLAMLKSISISPNPGFSLAITNLDILLVAITAIFLFKSQFTLVQGLGMFFAVIGIILLGL
jgi:drug/metabolite transporter (DMT)-like permease